MKWMKSGTCILAVFFVFSALSVMAGPPEKVDCKGAIEWDIAPEASLVSFSCEMGKYKKDSAIFFMAEVKNVADKPLRFRINVFLLDMDKAAGHLIPRKGKPPVVEPGKSVKVKFPVVKTEKLSEKMLVVVKTL